MKSLSSVFFAIRVLICLLAVQSLAAATLPERYVPHENAIARHYIVMLNDGDGDVASVSRSITAQHGGRITATWSHALRGFSVECSKKEAMRIARDARVNVVEDDTSMKISATEPTDVSGSTTKAIAGWQLDRISRRTSRKQGGDSTYPAGLYTYGSDGDGVIVYVVDTGVRASHNEFRPGQVESGYDTLRPASWAIDHPSAAEETHPCDNSPFVDVDPSISFGCPNTEVCVNGGHGTAVASLIGGIHYGVAKGVTIVPVRTGDCGGNAPVSRVISGLDWVVQNHADRGRPPAVVNMSSEVPPSHMNDAEKTAYPAAIAKLVSAGIVPVVAAGNNSAGTVNPDACLLHAALFAHGNLALAGGHTITVGATDISDNRLKNSEMNTSTGRCVDLFAPGSDVKAAAIREPLGGVFSASDDAVRTTSTAGTSFATPMVAGAVARLLGDAPDHFGSGAERVEKVWQVIRDSATNQPIGDTDPTGGAPQRMLYIASPAILKQPESTTAHTGESVVLTTEVLVHGNAPVSYSWRAGGYDSEQVVGTGQSLPLGPLQAGSNTYWVRVTAEGYSADSALATVKVCDEVAIQPLVPQDQSVAAGSSVSFTVSATGSGLTYEWYLGRRGDTSQRLPGTSDTLTTTVGLTSSFWVRVKSGSCYADSEARTVTVTESCVPAHIDSLTPPKNVTPGGTVDFHVAATGTNLTYQWYRFDDAGNAVKMQGEVLADLHLTNVQHFAFFKVDVTSNCGVCPASCTTATQYTNVVVIDCGQQNYAGIRDPYTGGFSIVTNPIQLLSANVSQSGTVHLTQFFFDNAQQPVSEGVLYEWIDGTTSIPYQVLKRTNVQSSQSFRAQPARSQVCFGLRTDVTINPVAKDLITSSPAPFAAVPIASTAPLSVTVDKSNLTGTVEIDWYATPATSIPIDDAGHRVQTLLGIQPTVTTSGNNVVSTIQARAGYVYFARARATFNQINFVEDTDDILVSCSDCRPHPARHQSGTLKVNGQERTYYSPSAGEVVTLGVPELNGNYTYEWRHSDSYDVSEAPFSTSTTINNAGPGFYWVRTITPDDDIISWGTRIDTPSTDSPRVDFTVDPPSQAIGVSAYARMIAQPAGLCGALTYQWYRNSADSFTGATQTGTGEAAFAVAGLEDHTWFWVEVTGNVTNSDGSCSSTRTTVRSRAIAITVTCDPSVSVGIVTTGDNHIGRDDRIGLVAYGTGKQLAYSWHGGEPPAGSVFSNASGVWVYPTVDATYWVHVDDACENGADSEPVHVYVCKPKITVQPESGHVLLPNESYSLSVTATAAQAGQEQGFTYQWYSSAYPTLITEIPGATGRTLPVTQPGPYCVIVYATCGDDRPIGVVSQAAIVDGCTAPRVTPEATTVHIGWGGTATMRVWADQATDLTYQWFNANGTPLNGKTSYELTLQLQSSAQFFCRVWSKGTCVTDSPLITVDVCDTPVIAPQPGSVTINSGQSTTLTAAATASTGDVIYEWYAGASGDTSHYLAAGPTLSTGALTADASYWVRVTRGVCTTDSTTAVVTVCAMTATATGGRTATRGQVVFLNAGATNLHSEYLTYAWFTGSPGNTSQWVGSSASQPVSPQSTTSYWVQITDGTCTANSNAVTVDVCIPTITSQPASTTIPSGTSAALSVAVDLPAGITYQWYVGTPGVTTNPVPGGTAASISVTPSTATSYWCRITSSCATRDSAAATVSVCNTPVVTPGATTIYAGSSQIVTLSVGSTGSELTYQWYAGASGVTTNPMPGRTTAAIAVQVSQTSMFWCRVTSMGVCSGNSPAITVDICDMPSITAQPPNRTINSGQSTSLSVTATSSTGTLAYQWFRGASGETADPVAGATSASLTTGPLTADATYWVRITRGACTIDSNAATVTVCGLTATAGGGRTATRGQTVFLSATAVNPHNATGITYAWYTGTPGTTTTYVGSSASQPVSPTSTTSYWVRINDGSCTADSNAVTITVCIPTITTQPANGSIQSGSPATLSIGVDLPGMSYQWYAGAAGVTTAPVSGGTAASIDVYPTTTTSYWCRVTSSCVTRDSNAATVSVCTPPSVTASPTTIYIGWGGTATPAISATGTNLTYQWYAGTSGNTANPLSGKTSSSMTLQVSQTSTYWCRVLSNGVCAGNSPTITVDVCDTPAITTQPVNRTVAFGQSTTLSVAATSGTGTLTYQWYRSASGDTSNPVSGATAATLNTGALTADTYFWARVTRGACTSDSQAARVSVCNLSASAGGGVNTRPSQVVFLTAGAINPHDPYAVTYAWYAGAPGNTSQWVGSSASQPVSPAVTTQYWVLVSDDLCSANSNSVTVNVCIPTITTQPTSRTITAGQSTSLSVAVNISGLSYQWYAGPAGTTTSPVSGGTAATLTVTPASTMTYWCRITSNCTSVDSSAATVTVCTPPQIYATTRDYYIAYGQVASLMIYVNTVSPSFQWYHGYSGDTSQPLSGKTQSSMNASPSSTDHYWCRVWSAGSCPADSTTYTVNVCSLWAAQEPASTSVGWGSTATLTFSVGASGGTPAYQWYQGTAGDYSNPISGATGATLTTPPIYYEQSFWCHVELSACTVDSDAATVTVW